MEQRDVCIDRDYLCTAIGNAITGDYSFYFYRKPNEETLHFGAADKYETGYRPGTFVIAPFDNDIEKTVSIYPSLNADDLSRQNRQSKGLSRKPEEPFYPYPDSSTKREEHKCQIETIKKSLEKTDGGKIIASRAILADRHLSAADVAEIIIRLMDNYPEAFVFLFNTGATGMWLGASPELLLQMRDGVIRSMSLAGTLPSSCNDYEWDSKNLEEQEIVTRFIVGQFRRFSLATDVSPLFSKKAGPVKHLCNEIKADVSGFSNSGRQAVLKSLIANLSPTPALCGFPREEAFRVISETEAHKRAYYGGFCGTYDCNGDSEFYVNLRSMRIKDGRCCLFCGGGITLDSNPDDEWTETENKAKTLLEIIE